MNRRAAIAALAASVVPLPADESQTPAERSLPTFRISDADWDGASVKDIGAVLNSAARVLWRQFPDRKLEPFVVMRGHSGPIVNFQRNLRGEIVMQLDTGGTYWCQYAYQFAHEFCHILAGFDNDYSGNLWLEETFCETASLYVLRHMAQEWKTKPPYPHWKDFSSALEKYFGDVVASREKIAPNSLASYFARHAETLRQKPAERALNGAMAVVLLDMLERSPEHWESVAWMNSAPSPPGETLDQYFAKWMNAVPQRHKVFVADLRKQFGIDDLAAKR